MPRTDDLLHAAQNARFMTTLDLKAGYCYWQVEVSEVERDETAFVSPFDTFRFKRMPFGLKNGPDSAQ